MEERSRLLETSKIAGDVEYELEIIDSLDESDGIVTFSVQCSAFMTIICC